MTYDVHASYEAAKDTPCFVCGKHIGTQMFTDEAICDSEICWIKAEASLYQVEPRLVRKALLRAYLGRLRPLLLYGLEAAALFTSACIFWYMLFALGSVAP